MSIDKLMGGLLALLVIVVVLVLMYRGWAVKKRRDAQIVVPRAATGAVIQSCDVFYVATTLADNYLERVALTDFAHRGYGRLTIAQGGVVLTLTGGAEMAIPSTNIELLSLTTTVIDKVVEKDGLLTITWSGHTQSGEALELSSHFRVPRIADRDAILGLYEQHTFADKK